MKLLNDINLDRVLFSEDGKSVELHFIDMDEGSSIGVLKCMSVYLCKYQNCFEDDDSLAAYIGAVNCSKLSKVEANKLLSRFDYSFPCEDLFSCDDAFVINVEGGEVMLDIICASVEYSGSAIVCE